MSEVHRWSLCHSSFPLLLLLSVNQTSLHPGGPADPPHSDRDASGVRAGGPKDHGGHRRLAQTLQIPKCKSEEPPLSLTFLAFSSYFFPFQFTHSLHGRVTLCAVWGAQGRRTRSRRCCCWSTMFPTRPSLRRCSASFPRCRGPSRPR